MNITLRKAERTDCLEIHQIQVKSFQPLLKKYQDFDTNPAAESLERIYKRFDQEYTTYYLICRENTVIGAMRICDWGKTCRLSPICILREFQGKGYAQQAISLVEDMYPAACVWELDTILQEEKLCYLYEKLGYQKTGEYHKIKDGMDLVFYRKEKAAE